MGLHEARDQLVDLFGFGLETLHVLQDERDAARVRRVLLGVFVDLLLRDKGFKPMLRDYVAPDGDALHVVQFVEADRIVEAAADALVHLARLGVRDPDGRHLHLVQDRVHDALLGGFAAASEEKTENRHPSAKEFVGLVHNHHGLVARFLFVADLYAHHPRLGLHVLAVGVALLDLPRGASALPGERTGERRLPRPRCAVEENVALPGLFSKDPLQEFAVLRRELPVVFPRHYLGVVVPAVEAAFYRFVFDAVDEVPDGPAVEIPVVVEQFELAEPAFRGKRLEHLGMGTVERHREIKRLVAVHNAARPREAGLALDVRQEQDLVFDVTELEDALELEETLFDGLLLGFFAVGQHVVLYRAEDDPALVALLFVFPERSKHIFEGILEIEPVTARTRLRHLVQLSLAIGSLDELDRLFVVEAVLDDVEEVVVENVIAEVVHHVAPKSHELFENERLRNLFELSHLFFILSFCDSC